MTRIAAILLASAAALALSACDRAGGGQSTTTMRNVEILPGTASDEMVTLDQASGDGTAIDQSTAIGPATPGAATADAAGTASDDSAADEPVAGAAPAADGGDTTKAGDVVIRPPTRSEPVPPAK